MLFDFIEIPAITPLKLAKFGTAVYTQLWGERDEEEREAEQGEQEAGPDLEADEDFGINSLLEVDTVPRLTSKTVAKQLSGLFPALLKCYSCKQLLDFPYQHPLLAVTTC
jgi:hypothetical protein